MSQTGDLEGLAMTARAVRGQERERRRAEALIAQAEAIQVRADVLDQNEALMLEHEGEVKSRVIDSARGRLVTTPSDQLAPNGGLRQYVMEEIEAAVRATIPIPQLMEVPPLPELDPDYFPPTLPPSMPNTQAETLRTALKRPPSSGEESNSATTMPGAPGSGLTKLAVPQPVTGWVRNSHHP